MADHLFYPPALQVQVRPHMPEDMEVTVLGERLLMLPERALYWPGERTLFVSDPELGRAAAYHKVNAVLLHTRDELARLDGVVARTGAQRILLMGELLHLRGRATENLAIIGEWMAQLPVEMIMLRAKPEDDKPKKKRKSYQAEEETQEFRLPEDWPLTFWDEPAVDAPFLLANTPISSAVGYVLTGGQHPGAAIAKTGKIKGALFPCFYFGVHTGMIPAFGSPTGLSPVTVQKKDRVFIAAGERIVSLS